MEYLLREQQRLLDAVTPGRRYLYDRIAWDARCIGILGARGTGKTTLMLQRIKAAYPGAGKALYVSVDSPYFAARALFDFALEFHQMGGEALFLDEIHKYADWSVHVKSIFDALPNLTLVFSGSSLLQIAQQKGDLSRRAIIYNLHGLSLREYLNFVHQKDYPAYPLDTLLKNHQHIANELCRDIKPLKEMRDYLQSGYYPFFLEGTALYKFKRREVINQILEVDLPLVSRIEPRQISKIKKLLYLLATSVPFVPNIAKLAEATDISRPRLYEYLEKLQDAKLINLVRSQGRGYEVLTKPDKILLDNSNLMFAITNDVNTGALRELFFVNQLRNAENLHPHLLDHSVELAASGDFFVNGRHTFEVGGKKKGFKQIANTPDAHVVADDLEVGFKNKLPLWMFGLLY